MRRKAPGGSRPPRLTMSQHSTSGITLVHSYAVFMSVNSYSFILNEVKQDRCTSGALQ